MTAQSLALFRLPVREAIWYPTDGLKVDPPAPATPSEVRELATEFDFAVSNFRVAVQADRLLAKPTIARIYSASVRSSKLGKALLDWGGNLSPSTERSWFQCLLGLGTLGGLQIDLEGDPFGGGTSAPHVSYPLFLKDAQAERSTLMGIAACLERLARTTASGSSSSDTDSVAHGQFHARPVDSSRSQTAPEESTAAYLRQEKAKEAEAEAERRLQLRKSLDERAAQTATVAQTIQSAQGQAEATAVQFAEIASAQTSDFKGMTWHASFAFGAGGTATPIVSTATVGGPDKATAGGFGPAAELSIWPVFGEWFGVGGFVQGTYGLFASLDSSTSSDASELSYGAKLYVGLPDVAGIVEYGGQTRGGSASTDYASIGVDYSSNGSGNYSARRLGLGGRIGLPERSNLEVVVFNETPDRLASRSASAPARVQTYRARLLIDWFGMEAEYAPRFPVVGASESELPTGGPEMATMWGFRIFASFGLFGDPFRSPTPDRRRAID